MIVVEERGMGRCVLFAECVEGGTVDEINVEPTVVVVIDQAHAGTVGVDDEAFVGSAHGVGPSRKASGFGHVFKDDRAGVDKAAGGGWSFLRRRGGGGMLRNEPCSALRDERKGGRDRAEQRQNRPGRTSAITDCGSTWSAVCHAS